MAVHGPNKIVNQANTSSHGTFLGKHEQHTTSVGCVAEVMINVSGDFYDNLDAYSSPQVGSISQSMAAMQPAESTVIVSRSSLAFHVTSR